MATDFDGKFEVMAFAVARGRTVAEAGKEAGWEKRTAYRHAATLEFRARVNELRRRLVDETLGRLAEAGAAAAATLVMLLAEDSADTIRLGSARAILSSLVEYQNHAELADRVAELEKRLNDGPQESHRQFVGSNGHGPRR